MITNFEVITAELTAEEKLILPYLLKGFSSRTRNNPVKAPDIVAGINAAHITAVKFTESRLRKMCNFIRSNGMLPLIATSRGYYVSYDEQEIKNEMKSLLERAESIVISAKGLEKFPKKSK